MKNLDNNLPNGQINQSDQSAFNSTENNPALAEMPDVLSGNDIAEYPTIIRRIITDYAETIQERSQAHRILSEMPQGNSQALKTKRAEIFDLVKAFTVRLEYLFNIRQQFEKDGTCPTEDEVWPAPKELPETTLSEDPEELRKMKKNKQTANTKDQNMLDFQTMVKGSEKKPMPSGPKRTRIENRIKGRLKSLLCSASFIRFENLPLFTSKSYSPILEPVINSVSSFFCSMSNMLGAIKLVFSIYFSNFLSPGENLFKPPSTVPIQIKPFLSS